MDSTQVPHEFVHLMIVGIEKGAFLRWTIGLSQFLLATTFPTFLTFDNNTHLVIILAAYV